jgi:hypothetical protein
VVALARPGGGKDYFVRLEGKTLVVSTSYRAGGETVAMTAGQLRGLEKLIGRHEVKAGWNRETKILEAKLGVWNQAIREKLEGRTGATFEQLLLKEDLGALRVRAHNAKGSSFQDYIDASDEEGTLELAPADHGLDLKSLGTSPKEVEKLGARVEVETFKGLLADIRSGALTGVEAKNALFLMRARVEQSSLKFGSLQISEADFHALERKFAKE